MKKRGLLCVSFLILSLLLANFILAGELRVTEEHPFLVNGEWISASQLVVGDTLSTVDGKKVRITSLDDVVSGSSFPVYNIEAGVYHNFVVDAGDGLEVVVHNSDRYGDYLDNAKTQDLTPVILELKRQGNLEYFDFVEPSSVRTLNQPLPAGSSSVLEIVPFKWDEFVTPSVQPSVTLNTALVNLYRGYLSKNPDALVVFDKLVSKFRVYSEAEFDSALKTATAEMLDSIRGTTPENSQAIMLLSRKPHSSPNYVLSKIKNMLKESGQIKEGIFLNTRSYNLKTSDILLEGLLEAKKNKFVTFDDASYSGMELDTEYLVPLARAVQNVKAKGINFNEPIELHIVCPYVTQEARATILNKAKNYPNLKVYIHTDSEILPIIGDLLTTYESDLLNSVSPGFRVQPYRSAFVLEHKVADVASLGVFGETSVREGLYKPTFPGYDFSKGIKTIYKIPGTPLYEIDDLIFTGVGDVNRANSIKKADLFVFQLFTFFIRHI